MQDSIGYPIEIVFTRKHGEKIWVSLSTGEGGDYNLKEYEAAENKLQYVCDNF